MNVKELIETLKLYPEDVQVVVGIDIESENSDIRLDRPVNSVQPYAYNNARAVQICYISDEE